MSLSRDDLRTRSEAVELPRGECGRGTAREHREDGADDHSSPTGKLGVCAVGSSGEAQSPRGAAASGGIRGTWVTIRR
jgi:hypothetical protein